ncbi:MAG: hypothetical protein M5R42_15210 [Rhodocyclaceae bacterium]|nr:hypothetical protein [Rhodocyclaceae bacterium]
MSGVMLPFIYLSGTYKLVKGKAAPFQHRGPVRYVRHSGNKPMSVVFDVPELT